MTPEQLMRIYLDECDLHKAVMAEALAATASIRRCQN